MDPIKVVINGYTPASDSIDVPDFPSATDSATHKIALRNVIYIDQDDFREVISYFLLLSFRISRLLLNQNLKCCFLIFIESR